MSRYDPPLPPEYPTCPFCDHALEDKGFSRWHDWVCVNPDCEHSSNYTDMAHCAECDALVKKDALKQDPYPVPNWLVCPDCYKNSLSAMGADPEPQL